MAERIEILLGVTTLGDVRNILIEKGPDPPTAKGGKRREFRSSTTQERLTRSPKQPKQILFGLETLGDPRHIALHR